MQMLFYKHLLLSVQQSMTYSSRSTMKFLPEVIQIALEMLLAAIWSCTKS